MAVEPDLVSALGYNNMVNMFGIIIWAICTAVSVFLKGRPGSLHLRESDGVQREDAISSLAANTIRFCHSLLSE